MWNPLFSAVFLLDWRGTLFWTENILNYCDCTDIVWEIKDFKFSDVSLRSYFCSFLKKSHLYRFKILRNILFYNTFFNYFQKKAQYIFLDIIGKSGKKSVYVL